MQFDQKQPTCAQMPQPLVDDWVQTLGMSEGLSSALRLPLHLKMQDFLEDLPGGADESVHNKLRVFLEKRQKEALEREPVEHSKRTTEFLMYGYGGKKGVRLVDKILDVDLHRPPSKPLPSWRDDHADLLNSLANDLQNETGRVSHYKTGGRVNHFTLNDRKRLASSLGTAPRLDGTAVLRR